MTVAAVADNSGAAAVLTIAREPGEGDQEVSAIVSRFDRAGNELLRSEHVLFKDSWLVGGSVFSVAGKLFVVVNQTVSAQSMKEVQDEYGLLRLCAQRQRAHLIEIDPHDLKVAKSYSYGGIRISRIIQGSDGGLLASATLHSDCNPADHAAAVVRLEVEGKIKVLFVDDEPFSSFGTSLVKADNGRLFMTGVSKRSLDSYESGRTAKSAQNFEATGVALERTSLSESFVVELDFNVTPRRKTWVRAGSSLWVNDVAWLNGELHFVGSSGGEVLRGALQ
jgi:hypothetical protein